MNNLSRSNRTEIADYATDPLLSRETRTFLTALNTAGGAPIETLTKEAARQVLADAQAAVPVDLSGISITEKTIISEGYKVKIHVVRPQGTEGRLPAFIFIHGGGWILGDFPTHKRLVRDLVVQSGCVAVFVNYTPSPEAHYPQAVNEIYAVTKWVAANGDEIGVDGSNIAVVGNSVGGNMTAVTGLKALEKGGPKLKLLVMMWPIVDADFETTSYQQFGKDRFLTASMMKWMYDQYTTDPDERKEIFASPLQATIAQLKDLPPTLIQVAENDILRDEGEAFGRKLDEAGVAVTTIRYNGMIHDFGLLNGLATLPAVKSLIAHAAAALRSRLG
ncbi:alpha/beta hydrolase [Parapedobacter soli]|uniref:alpha/beta hydrolase n=1 Tax=Parapedobacter soli TaxID=416955 RepID=UPI0021C5DB57|nr:alpha/beta hydrolase [Parapedobacter soli]